MHKQGSEFLTTSQFYLDVPETFQKQQASQMSPSSGSAPGNVPTSVQDTATSIPRFHACPHTLFPRSPDPQGQSWAKSLAKGVFFLAFRSCQMPGQRHAESTSKARAGTRRWWVAGLTGGSCELRFCSQAAGRQGMVLSRRGTCVLERSSNHGVRSGRMGRHWCGKPGEAGQTVE